MNTQTPNKTRKLGASRSPARLAQASIVPKIRNGTLRPRKERVRSLSRPTTGWTAAATRRPLKPNTARYVFLSPSGATVRTRTGRMMASIARINPVTPKLNAFNLTNARLLQDSLAAT